jgi:hypothetical protein
MAHHLDAFALEELRTNARGGKSAQVTHQSGKPVVVVATVPLSCPFGAGLYQEDGSSTRLNIDFGQLKGLEAIASGLDEQLINAAITAKESLWPGKNLTPAQVRESYTSPLKQREGYSTTFRCKLDTEKVRCWTWEGAKIPLPGSKGKWCQICPRIQLQSLWFRFPLKWGATWLATDLRIQEPCIECPW